MQFIHNQVYSKYIPWMFLHVYFYIFYTTMNFTVVISAMKCVSPYVVEKNDKLRSWNTEITASVRSFAITTIRIKNGRTRTSPIQFRKIPPRGIHADEQTARWQSAAINPVQTSDIPTKIAQNRSAPNYPSLYRTIGPFERSNANDRDG